MASYFYDAQIKNVLSQVLRVFSDIKYMTGINHTGRKELLPVLCEIGSTSRIVGSISKKNSENVASYAPMISCWISNFNVARNRTMNPTHEQQIQVNEQHYDYATGRYTGEEGSKYLLERLVPVPFDINIQVDIWTTNEEMKLQILEQILVMFNPSIELQKNENPLDWSNNMTMELESINYSSRSVPIGDDMALEVTSLNFRLEQFYLNPPAKLKKQVTIQNIITNVGFDDPSQEILIWPPSDYFQNIETYKNLELEVMGDELKISSYDGEITWLDLFEVLNMNFEPDVYSIRLRPGYEISYSSADILVRLSAISSTDPSIALGSLNLNSLPGPTLLPVNAFINPNALFPGNGLDETIGNRYVISKNIIPGTQAWGALEAYAGSIIQTDDGVNWYVSLDSTSTDMGNVVRNLDDGYLYVQVTEDTWIDCYQGRYRPGYFRLCSIVNNNIGN